MYSNIVQEDVLGMELLCSLVIYYGYVCSLPSPPSRVGRPSWVFRKALPSWVFGFYGIKNPVEKPKNPGEKPIEINFHVTVKSQKVATFSIFML